MALKLCEIISILLSALVGGMYWGPWLALSRSLKEFEPKAFLAIVNRLNTNMEKLMTFLTPASLLSIIPVLYFSFHLQVLTFYFNLAGFILFLAAMLVTVIVEVPIVKQIITWKEDHLPANWQQLRDRWAAFHIIRVMAGIIGLLLLITGAILI